MDEKLRKALGDGPDDFARTRQRARFLAEARRPARMWRDLAVGVVAAAVGAVAVATFWTHSGPKPLHVVSSENVSSENALVFNEASEVSIEPGGHMRLERTAPHEAVVVVESGELHASITSGLKNVWRFRAGPNEVIVRGTKLSVSWTPQTQALAVGVTEGKVEVHLADGRIEWVTAGQRLEENTAHAAAPSRPEREVLAEARAAQEEEAGEVQQPPAKAPAPHVDVAEVTDPQVHVTPVVKDQIGVAPTAAPSSATSSGTSSGTSSVTKGTHPVAAAHAAPSADVAAAVPAAGGPAAPPARELRGLVPEWKRQAEGGHYGRAVTLVEEQGVDAAMGDASSDDLLLLADAARLVRRVELGRTVLQALRDKFKGTPDAMEAAFRLGRLEFDAQQYDAAARWFDAYVREAPQGPFAVEALGRRLDAWRRIGDARAFDAATQYLQSYPKGAYAPLAKQVLAQ
jgi:hypothetical protein